VPATLEITGNFPQKTEAVLNWDSGRGFNQSEVLPVVFEEGAKSQTIELPELGLRKLKLTSNDTSDIKIDSLKLESSKW